MNLRNFHSSRRMTRRSSTCRSALLMVLPKRRNNLYISILRPRQGAGAGSGFTGASAGAARAQERAHGRLGLAGAGSGASAGASTPSFLIRLRRWLSRRAQAVALFTSSSPSMRCTEESSPRSRSLAPFTFSKVVPLGSARRRKEWLQAAKEIVQVDPRVHTGCGQVTVFETSI